jgi:hypothetical protein
MTRPALLIASLLGLAVTCGSAAAQGNQRSAQSDCTREVERRGYTVLSTGNFEQSRDGWQIDVRARDQRGRVTEGTCFVETRTGDVSLYGFGWGGTGTVERFEFNCASKDDKYRECQLPIDGRARLVKRKSEAPCIEGQSWGQRGDRVWVNRGCRANFEVVRGGSGGSGSGQTIECRSQNDRYRECAIRDGYEGRLARDYTGRCRKDSTWGNRPGVVWVTSGCQGSFQLVPTSGGSGSGGDNAGQQQRAEVQCRNEAKRRGIKVRNVAPVRLQGNYWETVVEGTFNGQPIQPVCRFYPNGNRAELLFGAGGGTGGAVTAERACLDESQRQGYRVVGQSAAQPIAGGYGMSVSIRRGNGPAQAAYCRYRVSNARAELEIVAPQPR